MITDDYRIDTELYKLNFLHSTMQEFMAALFVASRAPEEQAAFWRKHLAMLYRGSSHDVEKDCFLAMFTFYCGLTGLDNKDVQDHLLEEVDNLWVPYYGPVLVPLRELRKREKVDLEDLLKVAYENLPNGVVQHIEAVGGKEMLFILDGYDKIKSHTKGAPAVVESLLEKSYLQHSSVIVTSRGIAARSLYQYAHKRFVIQGLKQV